MSAPPPLRGSLLRILRCARAHGDPAMVPATIALVRRCLRTAEPAHYLFPRPGDRMRARLVPEMVVPGSAAVSTSEAPLATAAEPALSENHNEHDPIHDAAPGDVAAPEEHGSTKQRMEATALSQDSVEIEHAPTAAHIAAWAAVAFETAAAREGPERLLVAAALAECGDKGYKDALVATAVEMGRRGVVNQK
jgi:hypothetical protein